MAANPRIIKKYPNRRLYDTEQSRYITLADLQKLTEAGEQFEVKDASSGEDITRMILLQIISDQENGGNPVFTTDILTRIIRFYGGSVQDALTSYLEQSLSLFEHQQKNFQDQVRDAMQHNPVNTMSELTQRNLEIWQDIQNQFFQAATGSKPEKDKDKTDT
ncbi:MAG: polyhydroxyalkanoate synthesis repressor PhaR [Gammaproteobacteria bacterium]|nr:polyhydroxyalkanoate synthesis repressor PhaR [Gammaproteobacteria bacterium]